MNYFLLVLTIAVALMALVYTGNILRVAFGAASFDSGLAAIWHFIVAPTAGVTEFWLFQIAVAQ